MTSAHPAYYAEDGLTYLANFAAPQDGLTTEPFTRLLWWDGRASLNPEVVDREGCASEMACHSSVTRNHVILFDTAFRLEAESFSAGFGTRPALLTQPCGSSPRRLMTEEPFKSGGRCHRGARRCIVDDTDDVLNVLIAPKIVSIRQVGRGGDIVINGATH